MAAPAPGTMGKTLGDLAGPDLGAVGNAARVSKKASAPAQELTGFSVKKGDNGGVIVSEMYQKKAPEGRRPASFLLGGLDVKENPFSASDGAAAVSHITGLLGTMGVEATAPEPDIPEAPMPEGPPPGVTAGRMTGPRGGTAAGVSGPGGSAAAFKRPPNLAY